ncbi:MAG: hypothetical protein WC867_08650 [Candidatus Pacearchaeota archaeon]|jgi:hypothetical protein
MEKLKFIHRVSKGTRFNQIYIPKEMITQFEAGDLVEVTLLEKSTSLYSSPKLGKLSEFKINLIKEIFSELKKYKEIKQVFIIGSFLTQKHDFNDIDIIIISDKDIEKEVYKTLMDKFELKFHILIISENNFKTLQKFCPIHRSMLYYFISDKKFSLPKDIELNKDHIRFLLMMPEDLLNINLNSRVFYDSIRRLLTIEKFLENISLDPLEINKEIKNLLGDSLATNLRQNGSIDKEIIKKLREVIKSKLNLINKLLDQK